MAHIDNLKERLLSDAKMMASTIDNEARAKADEIVKGAKQKAGALIENNKVKAEKDGRDKYERMISKAQLDIRNKALETKQQSIERVLKLSIDKINSMGQEEYSSFIEKLLINSIETGDEEVIFSIKDKARVDLGLVEKVNAALTASGKKGMLKLSSETANIPSGFLLRRGGLEINCSIESILRVLKDDLEGKLSGLLFENQN
jgi:V/A-type H+/Na+-transporting ATPase subunit E